MKARRRTLAPAGFLYMKRAGDPPRRGFPLSYAGEGGLVPAGKFTNFLLHNLRKQRIMENSLGRYSFSRPQKGAFYAMDWI